MNPLDDLRIGNPDEWPRFIDTFPGVEAALKEMADLANVVFNRQSDGKSRANMVVFALGMMCLEDFEDIFVLSANGRGFGANKVLRGMYERVVTLTYIHKNPDEAETFFNFEKIRTLKLQREVAAAFPEEDHSERISELEKARDEVKAEFMRKCTFHKDCPRELEGISWTALGMPALAAKAEKDLREDLLVSYFLPMTETHPTFHAVVSRLEIDDNGRPSFRPQDDKSRGAGHRAFAMACKYALQAIRVQILRFPSLAPVEAQFSDTLATVQACIDAKQVIEKRPCCCR